MEHLAKKIELIEWLLTLKNDAILDKIRELKDKESSDFQENVDNGLTLKEFRTEIKKQIETFK